MNGISRVVAALGLYAFCASTQAVADPAPWTQTKVGKSSTAALCEGDEVCLRLGCAAPGAALILTYAEPTALPGFGRLKVDLTIDGTTLALPVKLDPSADHQSGRVEISESALEALINGVAKSEEFEISNGQSRWTITPQGSAEALKDLRDACAETSPTSNGLLDLAGLSGQIPVILEEGALATASGTLKALTIGAHGWRMTKHRHLFGKRPRMTAAQGFVTGPGRYLMVAELCGEETFFGPDGCGLFVSQKTGGRWSVVTIRPAGEVLTLDLDQRDPDGWPRITEPGGQQWSWRGDGYQSGSNG